MDSVSLKAALALEASGGDLLAPATGKASLKAAAPLTAQLADDSVGAGAGGAVALADGASITFPPGSLSGDATVRIMRVPLPAPLPPTVLPDLLAYDLSIDTPGVTFTAATIRLPRPPGAGLGTILRFYPESGEWADLGAEDSGDGWLTREVDHFSIAVPKVWPPPLPLPKQIPGWPTGPAPSKPVKPPVIPMVTIPAGTYIMGSEIGFGNERPKHAVHVDGFLLGRYEVTNAEFALFLKDVGNQTEAGGPWYAMGQSGGGIENDPADVARPFRAKSGRESHPVNWVSAVGAMAFCNWLSEKSGLSACYGPKDIRGRVDLGANGYRLPTEAEWEYAASNARGDAHPFSWGTEPLDLGDPQENAGNLVTGTTPVGSYRTTNIWGVYDLGGNVTEWVSDFFQDAAYTVDFASNPVGPSSGPGRSIRGANYLTDSLGGGYYLRLAGRNWGEEGAVAPTFGFRVARKP